MCTHLLCQGPSLPKHNTSFYSLLLPISYILLYDFCLLFPILISILYNITNCYKVWHIISNSQNFVINDSSFFLFVMWLVSQCEIWWRPPPDIKTHMFHRGNYCSAGHINPESTNGETASVLYILIRFMICASVLGPGDYMDRTAFYHFSDAFHLGDYSNCFNFWTRSFKSRLKIL